MLRRIGTCGMTEDDEVMNFFMISNFVKGKTAVFIDASNIYFSQRTLGWRIDFKKLLAYFKKNADLHRMAFYGALNPDNDRERKFHDFFGNYRLYRQA